MTDNDFIPYPDPEVSLGDVVLRLRGTDAEGNFRRVLNFPTVLQYKGVWDRRQMERLGFEDLPDKPDGAYYGVLCRWQSDVPHPLQGKVIRSPVLAYLVTLLRYGWDNTSNYRMMEGKTWDPPEPVFPEGYECPMPNKPVKDGVRGSERAGSNYIGFPTFCVGPRGYRGDIRGDNPNNAILNTYLATIQKASGLKNYDNAVGNFRPDDTEYRLAHVKEMLVDLPVVEDTGWKGDRFNCSIVDYHRTVTFERAPTDEELELFREMLRLDKCPGWTGIGQRPQTTPNVFTFTTTMDSSD